ncbi:hypothetical protein H0H93_007857 [Arthromyces matolae]|nr:hypothetical protein H0H93_007857 [Arthromyces matolae]
MPILPHLEALYALKWQDTLVAQWDKPPTNSPRRHKLVTQEKEPSPSENDDITMDIDDYRLPSEHEETATSQHRYVEDEENPPSGHASERYVLGSIMGERELDARFKAMADHPGLRHFKKGISFVSQWTGTEHKEMEKVMMGVLAGGVNSRVLTVGRALLDFIFYAQYQFHTTKTLAALQSSLDTFHANKDVFIELECREDFNIPKLHSMIHYVEAIRALGSADGYNTESPERLHIEFAKDAYRASNKRDYTEQMALWLQRREAMWICEGFCAWVEYGGADKVMSNVRVDDEDGDDEEDDGQAIPGF